MIFGIGLLKIPRAVEEPEWTAVASNVEDAGGSYLLLRPLRPQERRQHQPQGSHKHEEPHEAEEQQLNNEPYEVEDQQRDVEPHEVEAKLEKQMEHEQQAGCRATGQGSTEPSA